MKLEDINYVYVHWSESNYINGKMNNTDGDDINKSIDPIEFDKIINAAAKEVGIGYDKTCLSIKFNSGGDYEEVKFYLTPEKDSLVKLIS